MSGVSSTGASDVRAILAQNEIRVKRLFASYNPLTGEGSPIERVRLYFTSDSYVLIPVYMAITPTVAAIIAAGGVERYAVAEGIDPGQCAGPFIGSALYMISSFGVFRASKSSTKRRAALCRSSCDGRNSNWYASFFVTYSRESPCVSCCSKPGNGAAVRSCRCSWHGYNCSIVRDGTA